MDPNLFAIDSERLFEVLLGIITLSFFVERFLAVVFESRWLVEKLSKNGLKEPITVLLSVVICRHWDFDAISVIFTREKTELCGHLLTGGIVAGGSKASIKLFQEMLGAVSNAEKDRRRSREGARDTTVDRTSEGARSAA